MLSHSSLVWFFATPWTIVCQAPLSMGFSRQEYWSGLPFPSPGDLQDLGTEPRSLESSALAGGFFTMEPPGKSSIIPTTAQFPFSLWLQRGKCGQRRRKDRGTWERNSWAKSWQNLWTNWNYKINLKTHGNKNRLFRYISLLFFEPENHSQAYLPNRSTPPFPDVFTHGKILEGEG